MIGLGGKIVGCTCDPEGKCHFVEAAAGLESTPRRIATGQLFGGRAGGQFVAMPGELNRSRYVTIPSAERLDWDRMDRGKFQLAYLDREPVYLASRDPAVTGRRIDVPITSRRLQYELDVRRGYSPPPPDQYPGDGMPMIDLSGVRRRR